MTAVDRRAAGLAGMTAWLRFFGGDETGKQALLISTARATDPDAYRWIVRG